MSYLENPKTKDSGIFCCIPQKGGCPFKCADCFFQSGRSYLEPLEEKTPNIPPPEIIANNIIRINDGNDSSNDFNTVVEATKDYPRKFYNTSWPKMVEQFPGPVVLTLNPGLHTDKDFWKLPSIPPNLMFVRFRTNTWNLDLLKEAVDYYATERFVPVILTFMAYFTEVDNIPQDHLQNYVCRKRTTNSYWAITSQAWEKIMNMFRFNKLVHSCGRVEGEMGDTKCKYCGNCVREFFVTTERMKK